MTSQAAVIPVISPTHIRIFRQGSTTYFHSSLVFPADVRKDVFVLYSFVREADDFVDSTPQQADAFHAFCTRYRDALHGQPTGDLVIDSFVELLQRREFDPAWVDSFLSSMAMDLTRKEYATIADLDTYLYGSSEVIGLFMARIMDLPEASEPAARLLGKAMQFINFIRDIDEDQVLGRTYLPRDEWESFGLSGLSREEAHRHPDAFTAFIRSQLDRYSLWQKDAEKGYGWIPWRYLVPIRTASDMYRWTGDVIRADPLVVYRRKVKPSIPRIMASVLGNGIRTAPVLLLGPSPAVPSAVR